MVTVMAMDMVTVTGIMKLIKKYSQEEFVNCID